MILPRVIAEAHFKLASAEAALFELRMRMLAGTIPGIQDAKIDVNLATVQQRVCQHYQQKLTTEETELLRLACALRNKLLHCEFSTARRKLDEINPQQQPREGGLTRLDFGSDVGKTLDVIAGRDAGQYAVAGTTTRTLRDVYRWLHECQASGEFDEAARVFSQANDLLDQLPAR
jgi:hypothetical protein